VTGAPEGKLNVIEANSKKTKPITLKLIDNGRGNEYDPSKEEVW
jgi:hypothetical protein